MEENLLRETGGALGVALVFLYTGFKKAKKSGKNAGVAALWGVGQAVLAFVLFSVISGFFGP